MTVPGLADAEKGMWEYAPFSGIKNVPIADILKKKLNMDIFIENDVNACAVGEKLYGCCQNDDDFLWITISNGIGGALYINGNLYMGSSGNAGEIGHFIVEENTDAVCGCGKKGCLEALASGKGIEKQYHRLTGKNITAREIAALAGGVDRIAEKVYNQAAHYIGKVISYSVNLLNIKKVVVGGGVSQSFELLEKPMRESVGKYVFKQANPNLKIMKTDLGYYAALIGAAAVAQIQLGRKENKK